MRSLTANILSCVSIVLAVAGGAAAQIQNLDQSQTIHLQPFHGPNVIGLTHFGNCQWLNPRDEPNETLVSQPVYGSSKRVYYAARYGDAKDNTYTLVIDESGGTGTGFNTLYADLNNDNRLDPNNEKFALALTVTTQTAKNVRLTLAVVTAGKTIPYAFDFTAFRYKDSTHPVEKIHANCRDSTIMTGEAVFGGKRCKVALADLNSNGLFSDYEQDLFRGDRFFVDLNGDGTFKPPGSGVEESFAYAQFAKIGGTWYTVEASPDGGTVEIRPSHPTFGTVKSPASVKSVGLSSPKQFQRLEFEGGKAQALSGAYQVRYISLERVDKDGQRYSTWGQYRSAGPKITVEPNQEATLNDVESLTIQVAVLPTAEPNAIELEPRIMDRDGGSFCTLQKGNERHQPPARLVIKDSDGKQIADVTLEYG